MKKLCGWLYCQPVYVINHNGQLCVVDENHFINSIKILSPPMSEPKFAIDMLFSNHSSIDISNRNIEVETVQDLTKAQDLDMIALYEKKSEDKAMNILSEEDIKDLLNPKPPKEKEVSFLSDEEIADLLGRFEPKKPNNRKANSDITIEKYINRYEAAMAKKNSDANFKLSSEETDSLYQQAKEDIDSFLKRLEELENYVSLVEVSEEGIDANEESESPANTFSEIEQSVYKVSESEVKEQVSDFTIRETIERYETAWLKSKSGRMLVLPKEEKEFIEKLAKENFTELTSLVEKLENSLHPAYKIIDVSKYVTAECTDEELDKIFSFVTTNLSEPKDDSEQWKNKNALIEYISKLKDNRNEFYTSSENKVNSETEEGLKAVESLEGSIDSYKDVKDLYASLNLDEKSLYDKYVNVQLEFTDNDYTLSDIADAIALVERIRKTPDSVTAEIDEIETKILLKYEEENLEDSNEVISVEPKPDYSVFEKSEHRGDSEVNKLEQQTDTTSGYEQQVNTSSEFEPTSTNVVDISEYVTPEMKNSEIQELEEYAKTITGTLEYHSKMQAKVDSIIKSAPDYSVFEKSEHRGDSDKSEHKNDDEKSLPDYSLFEQSEHKGNSGTSKIEDKPKTKALGNKVDDLAESFKNDMEVSKGVGNPTREMYCGRVDRIPLTQKDGAIYKGKDEAQYLKIKGLIETDGAMNNTICTINGDIRIKSGAIEVSKKKFELLFEETVTSTVVPRVYAVDGNDKVTYLLDTAKFKRGSNIVEVEGLVKINVPYSAVIKAVELGKVDKRKIKNLTSEEVSDINKILSLLKEK